MLTALKKEPQRFGKAYVIFYKVKDTNVAGRKILGTRSLTDTHRMGGK
jgi:hypothetical protein